MRILAAAHFLARLFFGQLLNRGLERRWGAAPTLTARGQPPGDGEFRNLTGCLMVPLLFVAMLADVDILVRALRAPRKTRTREPEKHSTLGSDVSRT